MTLLLIALAWTTLLTLIVALCVMARLGDRDLEGAARASAPARRGQGTLPAHATNRSREHARRGQRVAA